MGQKVVLCTCQLIIHNHKKTCFRFFLCRSLCLTFHLVSWWMDIHQDTQEVVAPEILIMVAQVLKRWPKTKNNCRYFLLLVNRSSLSIFYEWGIGRLNLFFFIISFKKMALTSRTCAFTCVMLIDYSRKTAGDPAERDREIGLALKLSSGGKKARKASDQKHTHNLFFFFFSSLRFFFLGAVQVRDLSLNCASLVKICVIFFVPFE